MADLETQHAEKPTDVLNRLRRMLFGKGQVQGKKPMDSTMAEWLLDPYLRGGIEVLEPEKPPTG